MKNLVPQRGQGNVKLSHNRSGNIDASLQMAQNEIGEKKKDLYSPNFLKAVTGSA